MKLVRYGVNMALLLALLVIPLTLTAQADEPITVVGSQPVVEILQALVEAAELDVAISSSITGNVEGFSAFCKGESDIAVVSRPMSVEEEAECAANQIEFAEYLLGYDILTFIAHADMSSVSCLTNSDMNTLFSPSAQDETTDWNQIGAFDGDSTPLITYLPADTTTTYALLDRQISGFGLRGDAVIETDTVALVEAVRSTAGAIGVVRLSEAIDLDGVHVISLSNSQLGDCFTPSKDTVDNRQYSSADRQLAYVNQARMNKAGLNDLLVHIIGEDAGTTIADLGFSGPSPSARGLNQAIFQGDEETGRQFSKDLVAFQIPPNIFGQVNVAGSAGLSTYLQNVAQQFSALYNSVNVNLQLSGEGSGLRRLCNNEVDLVAFTGTPSAEQLANCEANNVATATIEVGRQAVVVLSNANDDYLECLTVDQVIGIWGNSPDGPALRWSEIDEDFPDSEILLVSPLANDSFTDMLLTPMTGPAIPARVDTAESNADPLYRSAAVGNVEGSMTYMSWQDYLIVPEEHLEGVQLVAVDDGAGCVAPTEDTILNGEYPYGKTYNLLINQTTLVAPEKQSFLWFVFSDENYGQFERATLLGPRFGALPDLRDDLQQLFSEATTLPPPMPETTPEVTPEATSEDS